MSAALRVVVVTFSPGESLAAFLDSLATATTRPYDVVLADNGSSDGSVEAAAANRPGVTLVRTGGNVGYGAAANIGAGVTDPDAGEEWVVVANPDITWQPGALDELLEAGQRWPRAGSIGPAILTPQGDLYPSARALPSLGRGIGHALCGWWWPANPWTASYRRERGAPKEGPAGWLSGSCLLLRRDALHSVGGFDPAYFMYFEDIDLGRRLAIAGWLNVYVPSAVVEHSGGHATSRVPRAMLAAHHRSAYRYLAEQYHGAQWSWLRAILGLGLGARYLVARVSRRAAEGAQPTRPGSVLTKDGH